MAARSDSAALELRQLELANVARDCVAAIATSARAKNVTLETNFESSEVDGDDELLHRVVLATLHNAVKYTPACSAIHVGVVSDGERATLYVRDEGAGFSEMALVHAFDRFWRDDIARARSSSGLGLAIASETVRRCGGSIRIENRKPCGSEVTITFPLSAGRRVPP